MAILLQPDAIPSGEDLNVGPEALLAGTVDGIVPPPDAVAGQQVVSATFLGEGATYNGVVHRRRLPVNLPPQGEDVPAAYGLMTMTDNAVPPVTVATPGVPVKALGPTALGSALLFDMPNDNELRYIGAVPRLFQVASWGTLIADSLNTFPNNGLVHVRLNDADIVLDAPDEFFSANFYIESTEQTKQFAIGPIIVQMTQNDYLSWWVDWGVGGEDMSVGAPSQIMAVAIT